MKSSKSRDIAFLGIMSALLIVFFALETVIASMWITPPAVLSLSLLFVICFSRGFKIGCFSGLLFGVASFVIAWCVGNPLFILPWISILPRLFVGVIAYATFYYIRKACKNSKNKFVRENLCYSIGAGVGIIVNTLFVLIVLTFLAPAEYSNTFVGWVKALITINFPIELGVAIVLVPLLSNVVAKVNKVKYGE